MARSLIVVVEDGNGPRFGQPRTPLSSSAKADDPVLKMVTSDREAAAYWIARFRGR